MLPSARLLTSDLTEEEVFKTLKTFTKNKSPGLDGLTAEFFTSFWSSIKIKLMDVYKNSFLLGILPECMRTGIITLLEKKGKDRLEIANWRPITLLNVDYKLLTKTLGQRLKTVLPSLINKDQNGFVPGGNIFYSAHTVRDILFYCKKENIDLILLALDYTKAFDSVNFEFIEKTFETFNFGDNFRKWINIIYRDGKSCISNNGHISECFKIERSTRQGDPISPLVFILGLEILFVTLRSDKNIKGIKIEKNELKLTAYADDASYFMKDKNSAENLMNKIELFSKTSGLEVNRSKSECLLLSFEMNLNEYSEHFLGIPVVENLKILGHFHGKNQLVCNFQNFYSKLEKITKILNVWKQRYLTIVGKNLLINSLSTSLFIFNAQIDIPPVDFIKSVEKIHKDFLWLGTAKIAHHTLISSYERGGIRYKDLNDFILSMNVKFLQKLKPDECLGHLVLPNFWIKQLFKIPTYSNNPLELYFENYFTMSLNILDCKYKLPRKNHYKGHPFYYPILKTIETLSENLSLKPENLLSIPIWFNRFIKTQFDADISRAGFNFIKDLFPGNQALQNFGDLGNLKVRKLRNIIDKIPPSWNNKVLQSANCFVTIIPCNMVDLNGTDTYLKNLRGDIIYRQLISNKTRLPTGLLHWMEDFVLSDIEINLAFTLTRSSSASIFDQVFQYKVLTQILPTNKYLHRYQVKDSDICPRCQVAQDTVAHNLWRCTVIVPYVVKLLRFLRFDCKVKETITIKPYIFGFKNASGLNHILLEFKKEIFYNWDSFTAVATFCEQFCVKIRKLIIKEKNISITNGKFDSFCKKWENFTAIYDFLGPDQQIIY